VKPLEEINLGDDSYTPNDQVKIKFDVMP